MRVNELAKELGKTSKEVLEILQRQNQDVKSHSSNINEEQIQMVRRIARPAASAPARPQAAEEARPASAAAKPAAAEGRPAGAAEAKAPKADGAGAAPAAKQAPSTPAEAPKKKIAAVYRPQNSQQRPARPKAQQPGKAGAAGQGSRVAGKAQNAQRPGTPAGAGRQQGSQGLAAGVVKQQVPQSQEPVSQGTEKGAVKGLKPLGLQGTEAGTQPSLNQGQAAAAEKQPAPQGEAPKAAGSQAFQNQEPASGPARQQGSQGQGAAAGARQQNPAADGQQNAPKGQGQTFRDGGRVQGNRGGNREGSSRDNRDGSRGAGSRDGSRQGSYGGGYAGSRDGNRQGGYGGQNRDGNRPGGFAGNRDGNRQGGYGGQNRDGNRPGGFAGNRDGSRGQSGQGRDGNRTGNYGGGFAGNRDGNRQGGYGGQNRDGNRPGGFAGNRDGSRPGGGYGANRDGNRGPGGQGRDGGRGQGGFGSRQGGARPGQRDSGTKSFDSPIQAKPTSNRKNNNNSYKNDRYDKKNVNEDGPRSKGGKVSKHSIAMPPKASQKPAEEVVKVITLPEVLTIKELADKMKMQPSVIIKKLFLQGQVVTVNSEIDFEKAEEIAMEYEVLCEKEEKIDVIAELLKEDEEDENDMVPRSPVVCVMGHVDHGKTSLLDAIRSTNVTSREAGGITQHIGAYTVEINGQQITFLDTPGHEAFTAMRMRGAQSTDIAILVVAADDGVMPQTVEAINHAKAAEVEIIVAINKIDKPSANIDRVKQELSEYELVPEDWGGSTIFVPVSAHTKEGIPELLEMILLAAEVKELKANPNRKARGLVIEAELDKGKGPVATILVQKGTLRVGDSVTAGACYGKVRAMMDDKGRRVKEAGPSQPVEILGLNDVPGAGDVLMATENEKEARNYAETFIAEGKNRLLEDTKSRLSLDDLFSQIKAGNVKELPLIVKADVQGSVEAVKESLLKLSNEEVMVKVIHGGVGAINESDVTLASASNAIIIGFNVRPDVTAKSIAEREKVDLRLYRVIYQAIEDVEAAMKGMLDPVFEEQVIGHAVVRQLFKASGVGTIAGSYVTDGKFQRGCSCRITRGKEQVFEGPLASLQRFKDAVKEVATGYECGLVFEKFNDIQEDDVIEAYVMVEVPR
ncbi:translation initiation factor IF-2 [Clostridiaceae bacterium]|nr:translation initiation factor IF-2 [Clostridiaceae bacterium]RKI10182.1 translation initiation factor IF-2 [bacterium 1XD21-70]